MIKLVHWMPWTGNPTRISRDVGYRQDAPAVIDAQVRCMKAAGFGGVVAWWQGPSAPFTHSSFVQMFYACLHYGMAFIPAMDQWIAKGQPAPTNVVISALTSADFRGMVPFFAKKWVLEFDLAANAGVNIAQVQAAVPGLTILSKHVGYSWPEVKPTIAETLAILKADNANPQMKIPCVFSRFNDGGYPLPNGVSDPAHFSGQRDMNAQVWNSPKDYADPKVRKPARIIEERAGKTYIDSLALASDNAECSGLVSWNDWDEQSAMEGFYSAITGIRIGP